MRERRERRREIGSPSRVLSPTIRCAHPTGSGCAFSGPVRHVAGLVLRARGKGLGPGGEGLGIRGAGEERRRREEKCDVPTRRGCARCRRRAQSRAGKVRCPRIFCFSRRVVATRGRALRRAGSGGKREHSKTRVEDTRAWMRRSLTASIHALSEPAWGGASISPASSISGSSSGVSGSGSGSAMVPARGARARRHEAQEYRLREARSG